MGTDSDSQGSHTEHHQSPSLLILHRIASYLSLNDAESMASSSSPFGTGNHSAATLIQLPDHHSLDYHFYHSIRRMSPSGSSVGKVRNSMTHSGCDSNVDEEDWFVGGGQQDNINSIGCGTLLPMEQTPGLETLSPLEEEFYGPRQRERPWTPAGQSTSENEKESKLVYGIHRVQSHDIQNYGNDSPFFIRRQRRQKKQALQNKLAAAVFAHPYPLRHYCLDAYATALNLSMERQKQLVASRAYETISRSSGRLKDQSDMFRHNPASPSTLHSCESPEFRSGGFQVVYQKENEIRCSKKKHPDRLGQEDILSVIETKLVHIVPLSVMLELTESACDLSMDALLATGHIGTCTINSCVSMLCDAALVFVDVISRVNPFHVFEFVVNAQRSAMGKTGDVLVSGIQSVATGVGSVSNAALNRLSRQGLALAGGVVGGSRSGLSRTGGMGSGGFGRARKDSGAGDNRIESKVS